MPTKAETVLQALAARLATTLPPGARLLRNDTLPRKVPPAGILILHDGDPGPAEAWMSPPGWYYEHRAEIDIVVDRPAAADRDAAFDTLKAGIGTALAADRTLGGLVDWTVGEAPAPLDVPVEEASGLKAATVVVVVCYATTDPLL